MKRIDFYTNPCSQYSVLNDFTEGLQKALRRQGMVSETMDLATWSQEDIVAHCKESRPDCTAGFNVTSECAALVTNTPHIALMVDIIGHSLELVMSEKTVAAFADQSSCAFFQLQSSRDALFFPHAIDRELVEESDTEHVQRAKRDFTIVMTASYIDHATILSRWQNLLSPAFVEFLESIAQQVATSTEHDLLWLFTSEFARTPAFAEELADKRIYLGALLTALDLYIRGKDREQLVEAIDGYEVHIFGDQGPTRGWDALAARKSNCIVHEALPYEEMAELFRHSEITLCSMPQFKDGLHERLLLGLAQGCGVLTNESAFLRANFPEFDALCFYRPDSLKSVNDTIRQLLDNRLTWRAQLPDVRSVLRLAHTWDNRAERLLMRLPQLLQELPMYKTLN